MAVEVTIGGLDAAGRALATTDQFEIESNEPASYRITGQELLDLVNASALLGGIAQVTGLSAALAALLPKAGGDMTGFVNLFGDATQALQPITYQQFQGAIAGFSVKAACYAATTANLVGTYNNGSSGVGATFTLTATGEFTTDSVTPPVGSRIFLLNQTDTTQNGIYTLTTSAVGVQAVLTRATDYDTTAEIFTGTYAGILNGTDYGTTTWYLQTSGSITVGTSNLVFSKYVFPVPVEGLYSPTPNTMGIQDTAVTPGTYGSASESVTFTVNDKGQLTAASDQAIAITSAQVTDFNSAVTSIAMPYTGGTFTGAITTSYGGATTITPLTLKNTFVPTIAGGRVDIAAYAKNSAGTDFRVGYMEFSTFDFTPGSEKGMLSFFTYGSTGNGMTLGVNGLDIAGTLIVQGAFSVTAPWIGQTQTNLQVPPTSRSLSAAGRLSGGGTLEDNRTFTQQPYNLYPQPLTETTTARTLAITDAYSLINCTNNTGTTTINIPLNASAAIPIGSPFMIYNGSGGAQLVNIAVTGGVTINLTPAVGNGGYIELQKIGTDTWIVWTVYELYTHATTFTWNGNTSPSQNLILERTNTSVKLTLPNFTYTPGGTPNGQVVMDTAFPTRFRPSVSRIHMDSFQAPSGTIAQARMVVSTAGVLTLQSATAGNFNTVSYQMDSVDFNYKI
jgi:hypothetical protein